MRRVAIGTVLLMCAALCGCGVSHIRALREAQTTFSQAAELDNRMRFDGPQEMGESPAAGYRLAAAEIQQLIERKGSDLKKDNLLCTAVAIRALSLWKLGDYENALAASKESGCVQESAADCTQAGSVPCRERAVLTALPALIMVDQAFAVANNSTQCGAPETRDACDREYRRVKESATQADRQIEVARKTVPENHPVQVYLVVSQLAAVRAWQDAVTNKSMPCGDRAQMVKQQLATLSEYKRVLKLQGLSEDSYQDWFKRFGNPERVPDCQ